MTNLKLTKSSLVGFTGRLLDAEFVDGVSQGISQANADTIAAAVGGVLVDDEGKEIGPAGIFYRRPDKSEPAPAVTEETPAAE
jgi:hypothetical protein